MSDRLHRLLNAVATALALASCQGQLADPAGMAPTTPTAPSTTTRPPAATGTDLPRPDLPTPPRCAARNDQVIESAPVRRLTRFEYDNTVLSLLGDDAKLGAQFAPDGLVSGFDNNAALPASVTVSSQYQQAAETLAARAVNKLDALMGCAPGDACARQFIERFGLRAFRRPLTSDELARWNSLYTTVKGASDVKTAVEAVVSGMLQSPNFLYHIERGVGPAKDGLVALSGFEVASRLSYFLWGSMPDEALFAAAAAGKLNTPEQIEAEARRMSRDPKAAKGLQQFLSSWLELPRLEEFPAKDPQAYPMYDEKLRKQMQTEVEQFLDGWWKGDGKLGTLLTATRTQVEPDLASKVYGKTITAAQALSHDPNQRAGLLTLPGIIAAHSYNDQTSPIHRGLFVRYRLMCDEPPPPPGDVALTPPPLDPKLGTKQRYAIHEKDPACGGCHSLMDEIGYTFENYDAIGRWRTVEENGLPVDASGKMIGSRDMDGAITGAVELSRKLAASTQVSACITDQWFTYAIGRLPGYGDDCAMAQIREDFNRSGKDVREVAIAVTRSPSFRFTRPAAPAPALCQR